MTASDTSPSSGKPQPEAQTDASAGQDPTQFVGSLTDEGRLELIKALEVSRIQTTFSGPLPPPEDFAKYASILPNAADRILSMAENEQKIRADGQAGMITNDRKRINGAIMIAFSLIAVSGLATWLGYASIAIPLGLVGMVSTLIRFLISLLHRT